MKKDILKQIYFYPLLAIFAIFGLLACSDDNDEIAIEPFVEIEKTAVSLDRLGFESAGEKAIVGINSNVYWEGKIVSGGDWLSSNLMGGYGYTELTLTATPNSEAGVRTAKMQLETLEGATYEIVISQTGTAEKLYFVRESIDGEDAEMVPLSNYRGWTNVDAGGVAFRGRGEGIYVDNTHPSTGYDGASGKNNIYFEEEGAVMTIGSMATKGETAFKLSFASMAVTESFNKGDLLLQVSRDNLSSSLWVNLPYTRSSESGKWAKSEISFKYSDKYEELYFRVVAKTGETFRIDDIVIEENPNREGNTVYLDQYIDDGQPDGYVYFEDDFSWITVGPDFINNPSDNTTEVRFTNITEMNNQDPTQQQRLIDSGWTYRTGADFLYMHQGYIKMGTTKAMGVLMSPPLSGIVPPALLNVKVTYKASMYQSADGTKEDLKPMIVRVADGTPGTINDKIKKEASIDMLSHREDMREYSFIVYGATAETQITFENYKDGTKNRMFIDDVKVIKYAP